MTLAERLAAIAAAPDEADLAELLGVAPAAIALGEDGLTVAGETVSYAEARRALGREVVEVLEALDRFAADRRTVTIGDLCPINSAK